VRDPELELDLVAGVHAKHLAHLPVDRDRVLVVLPRVRGAHEPLAVQGADDPDALPHPLCLSIERLTTAITEKLTTLRLSSCAAS
jgi:hypothetical protein